MYTFLIAVAFFFLLSGIIFGKNIRKHQFHVICIILLGTFLTGIIVNGVIGLNTPYSLIKVREKTLHKRTSYIEVENDSTIALKGYIDFDLDKNRKEEIYNNEIQVSDWVSVDDPKHIIVKHTTEDDSIPKREVYQYRRIVDGRWAAPVGIPRGDKIYHYYIPNDSANNEILSYLNEYFFVEDSTKNEKKKEEKS